MPKINKTNELKSSVQYIVNSINRCGDKDNGKAEFDYTNKILKRYIGKSIDDFEKEWEIPFKELDEKNTIVDVTSEFFSFQIYTVNDIEKIKYSEPGKKSEFSNQHNFYLPDRCYKENEKIKFIESFKSAIKLSKY
jgi:hypothetical protein